MTAGVKFGLLISAISDGPKRIGLFAESTNELKTLRIGPWIKNRILLIDLGFYKYQLFARIDENGGYFVSRLKGNADPLIVSVNRTCKGRSVMSTTQCRGTEGVKTYAKNDATAQKRGTFLHHERETQNGF